jgi:hypothetical protein
MSTLQAANAAVSPPVLLIAFRRPELTRRLLESIRAARPDRLYVACDGPRIGRAGEAEKVSAVHAVVAECVGDLNPVTLYRAENLGCGRGVSEAISWFFEHEEEGIILEDDCLPDASFYPFCAELLDRYRDVSNVMQVAGYNAFANGVLRPSDYSFTSYGYQWGWATWRRAWRHFDLAMASWPAFKALGYHRGPAFNRDRVRLLDATYSGQVDTWDYQWAFAMAAESGLSAVPHGNLVINLGMNGPDGTHYTEIQSVSRVPSTVTPVTFPLRHPQFVYADPEYDCRLLQVVQRPPLVRRILRRLRSLAGAKGL